MPPEADAAPQPRDPWDELAMGSVDGSAETDVTPPYVNSMAVKENQRYSCASLLGRGGMGQVWAAQDRRLARTVALKRAAPASLAALRLQREAEICARLEHPNIVPIYDAGIDEAGEPWYAMRLVRGQTLQQKLDQARDLAARLELMRPMLAVCQAVGYAHQHGVVHRDLKPANVMIGAHGEVQVLDWGLARRLNGPAGDAELELDSQDDQHLSPDTAASLTRAGAVMGTPRYMSPEACRGEPVGPAGDVWSLGAMLHHIVVGEPPQFAPLVPGQQLAIPTSDALLHAPDAPVELLALAAKALASAPHQRYRDAADLADDLTRWLDGKRIRAHAYTPGQLVGRLVRAWRGPLSVAAVALALLLVLGALAVQRLAAERDRAQLAESSARQALLQADTALTQALQGAALDAASELAQGEAEVLASAAPGAADDPLIRGTLAGLGVDPTGHVRRDLPLPQCAMGAFSPDGQQLFCWRDGVLQSLSVASGAVQWQVAVAAVLQVVATRDRVAVVSHARHPRQALVFAGATGAELQRVELPAALRLHAGRERIIAANAGWLLQFPQGALPVSTIQNPCGAHATLGAVGVSREDDALVAACGEALFLAEAATLTWLPLNLAGKPLTEHGISALALQSRAGLLVMGNTRGQLAAADLQQGQWIRGVATAGGMIRELTMAQGAGAVLAAVERGGALLWDPRSLAWPRRLPWKHSQWLGFSGDGQVLALGARPAQWQLQPAKPPVVDLVGRVGLTSAAAVGQRLAGSAGDGSAVVIDARNGHVLAQLPAGTSVAKRVSLSPDGRWLALTSTARPYLKVYETDHWQQINRSDADGMIRRGEFARDRLLVTTPLAAGGPLLFDLSSDGQLGTAQLRADMACLDGAVAQGGQRAVWLGEHDGRVVQTDLATPAAPQERLRHPGAVAVDISGDGQNLALASADSVWLHRPGQAKAQRIGNCDCRLMDVALDASAQLIAAPSSQGPVYVWRIKDRRLVAELRGHQGHAVYAGFGQDGDLLTAGWDGTVRRWHGATLHGDPLPFPAVVQQRWSLQLPDAMARPR
jgi:type II secretory pathway pseudopilin PulG